MTFGWRYVWSIAAVAVISSAAFFAISTWHAKLKTQARQVDRLALPVTIGFAAKERDYMIRSNGCALPNGNLVIDPSPVGPEALKRLSQSAEWTVISQRMKPDDVAHYYRRFPAAPVDATMADDVSFGALVLRGRCLVGMYEYWNKYQLDVVE